MPARPSQLAQKSTKTLSHHLKLWRANLNQSGKFVDVSYDDENIEGATNVSDQPGTGSDEVIRKLGRSSPEKWFYNIY